MKDIIEKNAPSISQGQTKKERIRWIDTSKGICILLVVLQHTSSYASIEYPLQNDFLTFRMPLYFILSGLFFKPYEGVVGFIKRKVNKLIIPYVFFFIVGGVFLPIILNKLCGIRIWYYSDYGFEALRWIFSEKLLCNPSIWFLACLFEVNIIFYVITMVARSRLFNNNQVTALMVISISCGILGILLWGLHIDIPYLVDSSLSALPFFCFGWMLRNKTNFLYMKSTKWSSLLTVLLVFISFTLIHLFNNDTFSIRNNSFGGLLTIIEFYPYGIVGTICVLSIARLLGEIPFISYLGRYSIIVLCTHVYIIQLSSYLFSFIPSLKSAPLLQLILIFVLTSVICRAIIPFFVKYLGYFTAQKDIIKIQ